MSRLAGQSVPVTERTTTQLVGTTRPFRGYRPLLNPVLADAGTSSSMSNLILRNGALTWDHGWTKYQSAGVPLPLGGYGVNFPGGAAGNPILLLDWYADDVSAGYESTIAVTSKTAANGNGNLFRYNHGGAAIWESLTDLTGAAGLATDETNVMDAAYYPTSYMVGVGTPPRGHYFVTNGLRDTANARVVSYPGTTASNYITLPTPGTFPNLSGGGNHFGCRSLCVYNERLYAFNTLENAILQPRRLRWTRPAFSGVSSTIWQTSTGQGAGAQDIFKCPGEGVAVRQIGRNLVCYFEEGVVIASYTTQTKSNLTNAYSTSQRGLLGTRAVVDTGGGVHFGVFTDGFWFLTESGTWQEAGIANDGGEKYRKFTDYFFSNLYRPNAYRIALGFDRERRLITITWPITDASTWQTWIYDIDLDEIYPQTYSALTGITGTQQGHAFLYAKKGTAQTGPCYAHATRSGHVWEHRPSTDTRNAQTVAWEYRTHYMGDASPWSTRTVLEQWLDVYGHGSANNINWQILGGRLGSLGTVTRPSTSTAFRDLLRFSWHVSDTTMQSILTGTHPHTIYRFGVRDQRTGEVP